MARYDFDLVVIGGGSGGVRAARVAAGHGARVAIVEHGRFGGTCVLRGCIPKKLFVYAADFARAFGDASAYGFAVGEVGFDWPSLVAAKERAIARLSEFYVRNLDGADVVRFAGHATLSGPNTVDIDGRAVRAERILIATGSHPERIAIPGLEHAITSDEFFDLPALPRRAVVVGGGYIAVELAQILAALGSDVSLIHRGPRVLRGFDDDIRRGVTDDLARAGVHLHMDNELSAIARRDDGTFEATLLAGDPLAADAVLLAIGRMPSSAGLGLEEIGVTLRPGGAIVVDGYSKTSVPHIYAVGDVTDRLNLTPVAIRDGQAFADTVFGGKDIAVDHHLVATAVFGHPPVGTVGLSEEAARAEHAEVGIYRAKFRPLLHTVTRKDEHTRIKLVVAGENERVVGLHIVGQEAPELIQCMAIAVKMGATKADFDATCAVHPTAAEELVLLRQKH
ncbi:MAG TPA: glutathione-disulfide reductase [Kofleriaceae bacterium]|nr:glutathione-disulfide reductase [Kofleriaceae bacterium]